MSEIYYVHCNDIKYRLMLLFQLLGFSLSVIKCYMVHTLVCNCLLSKEATVIYQLGRHITHRSYEIWWSVSII